MFRWLHKILSKRNFLESLKVIKQRPVFAEEELNELQRLMNTSTVLEKMLDDMRYLATDVAIQTAFKKDAHPHWNSGFSAGYSMAVFNLKKYFAGATDVSDVASSVKQEANDSPSGVKPRFIWKH